MADQIRIIVQDIEGVAERVVKQITLDATSNLVEDTPRDTGWARANWVPSIGAPSGQTAGTREAAESGSIDQASQQRGLAEVATGYDLNKGSVFITNNVPYVQRLNDGSSRQAPAGFVQAAVLRAVTRAGR